MSSFILFILKMLKPLRKKRDTITANNDVTQYRSTKRNKTNSSWDQFNWKKVDTSSIDVLGSFNDDPGEVGY